MGISIRAYARHRGVSDAAVRKAIKSGRITPEADGTLNAEAADRQWQRNTDTSRELRPTAPNTAATAVTSKDNFETPPTGSTTFMQARTANEVLKAQTNKLKLQQLKQEMVDRSQAITQVFRLARSERDAWLNWPARISAQMAAGLGVDPHHMHLALETAVREHLQELGEMRLQID